MKIPKFDNIKNFFIKNYHYLIPVIFIVLVFHKQFFHPFSSTFNFADNWGFLSQISQLRQYFVWEISVNFWTITTPLYSYLLAIGWYFVSDIFLFNILYFLHIFIAWIWSYNLFYKISGNKNNSILWATIFSFNSLTIYWNWFNLMWYCWIPFLIDALFFNKEKKYWNIILYSMLLILSWHYFLLTFFLILLSFIIYHLINKSINKSFFKVIFFSTIWAIFSAWVYIIPLFLTKNVSSTQTYANINKIEVWSIDIKDIITPNSFNFITDSYSKHIPLYKWWFRYSIYFWIIWIILIIFGLFNTKKNNFSKYYYILWALSFILFLGWSLYFFWYKLFSPLPFSIFDKLWLSGIFRKSAYFFYLLAFVAWYIVSVSKLNFSKILTVLIALWIVLENNFSFYRAEHIYEDYKVEWLERNRVVFALPNTNYSMGKYRYILSENWYYVTDYPDWVTPYLTWDYDNIKNDCFMSDLLNLKSNYNCKNKLFPNIDFFYNKNISDIIVFKNHLITYFFYDSWKDPNNDYYNVVSKINQYPQFFIKKLDTPHYTIYWIKGMENVSYFSWDNIIYKKLNSKKFELKINNIKDKVNLSYLNPYSNWWKLYPSNKFNCESKNIFSNHIISSWQVQVAKHIVLTSWDRYYDIYRKYSKTIWGIQDYNEKPLLFAWSWDKIMLWYKYTTWTVMKQTWTWNITECINDWYKFFEGDELWFLIQKPVFDETHKIVNDYANGWTLDAETIKKTFPKDSYSINPDGSVNVNLILYFIPQAWFYIVKYIFLWVVIVVSILLIYNLISKNKKWS